MSKKYPVTFDFVPTQPRIETCTICGGKVEECPVVRGVCYDCYRDLITQPLEVLEPFFAFAVDELDASHNYIIAAEAGDRAALAYGDADLGTRYTISGGEVMELGPQSGTEDLPF